MLGEHGADVGLDIDAIHQANIGGRDASTAALWNGLDSESFLCELAFEHQVASTQAGGLSSASGSAKAGSFVGSVDRAERSGNESSFVME